MQPRESSTSYSGKTCVVTGGAGAIGSRLVRRLLDAGAARVNVVDDLSSGHEWLLPFDAHVEFHQRSVVDGLPTRMASASHVWFHLAAHFANQNSVDHPLLDLRVNGEGTLQMLLLAAEHGAERFVFASAGCAAGHEDTPYQIHKALGEAYCRYYADRVPTAVCRFHNSYGPGEVPGRYRNVVPNWIWAAMRGEPLVVYGDGTDARDFIFVDDLVGRMLDAEPSRDPHAFGTGVLTLTADLARMVLDLTGSRSDVVYRPSRRWDHLGRTQTQDAPFVPLEEGLKRTIAWFEAEHDNIERSVRR